MKESSQGPTVGRALPCFQPRWLLGPVSQQAARSQRGSPSHSLVQTPPDLVETVKCLSLPGLRCWFADFMITENARDVGRDRQMTQKTSHLLRRPGGGGPVWAELGAPARGSPPHAPRDSLSESPQVPTGVLFLHSGQGTFQRSRLRSIVEGGLHISSPRRLLPPKDL